MAYVERVNLAIDHVVSHLAEPLRLEDVSRAALLSPFHFHRVFQALVGVTLAEFVKRLRLERALFLMAHARRLRVFFLVRLFTLLQTALRSAPKRVRHRGVARGSSVRA
jgi:AraC-like DNA-binding protein